MTIKEMMKALEELAKQYGEEMEIKVFNSYWAEEGYGENADEVLEEEFSLEYDEEDECIAIMY